MDVTMSFYTQDIWTWWLALYLYFGGLGAAVLVVSFLTDMYMKQHKELVIWGAISGVVMLSLGSLLLFIHLLDHLAVIHVLNPFVLFLNPSAWIAWGTQFIVWMMVWGVLYALPYLVESDNEASIHFYLGNLSHMRKELFPALQSAYGQWQGMRDLSPLQRLAEEGAGHWQQVAETMLQLHAMHGPGAAALIKGRLAEWRL